MQVRNFERALLVMWEQHCLGQAPQTFEVKEREEGAALTDGGAGQQRQQQGGQQQQPPGAPPQAAPDLMILA